MAGMKDGSKDLGFLFSQPLRLCVSVRDKHEKVFLQTPVPL